LGVGKRDWSGRHRGRIRLRRLRYVERISSADIRAVKLGMTKPQVQRILGKADEVNELYGLSDRWVDWLCDYDNGKSAVTFSKAGRVTQVMDCPKAICTVIARRD
jgi:hypothetical protein